MSGMSLADKVQLLAANHEKRVLKLLKDNKRLILALQQCKEKKGRLERANVTLQKELRASRVEMQTNDSKHKQLQATLKRSTAELGVLTTQLRQSKNEISKLQARIRRLNGDHAATIQDLRNQMTYSEKTYREEKDRLRQDLEQSRQEKSTIEEQKSEQEATLKKSEMSIATLREALRNSETENQKMKATLQTSQDEIDTRSAEKEQLQASLARSEAQLKKLTTEGRQLNTQISELQARIQRLNGDHAAEIQDLRKQSQQEKKTLQSQVKKLKKLDETKSGLIDKCRQVVQKNKEHQAFTKQLAEELRRVKQIRNKQDIKIKNLERGKQLDCQRLQAARRALTQKLKTLEGKQKKIKQQHAAEIHLLENTHKNEIAVVKQLKKSIQKEKKALEGKQKKIKQQHAAEIHLLENTHKNEIAVVKQLNKSIQKEKKALSDTLETLRQNNADLESRIKQLNVQIVQNKEIVQEESVLPGSSGM